jgi:hypothetical protein
MKFHLPHLSATVLTLLIAILAALIVTAAPPEPSDFPSAPDAAPTHSIKAPSAFGSAVACRTGSINRERRC